MSFGWDSKSRWPLLSGVYARGSKRSHQSALECVNVVDSTAHSKPSPRSASRCGWKRCPALKKKKKYEKNFSMICPILFKKMYRSLLPSTLRYEDDSKVQTPLIYLTSGFTILVVSKEEIHGEKEGSDIEHHQAHFDEEWFPFLQHYITCVCILKIHPILISYSHAHHNFLKHDMDVNFSTNRKDSDQAIKTTIMVTNVWLWLPQGTIEHTYQWWKSNMHVGPLVQYAWAEHVDLGRKHENNKRCFVQCWNMKNKKIGAWFLVKK